MTYKQVLGMIVDEESRVAVQHTSTGATNLKIGDTIYIWTPRHNVSLCWVKPEHLNKVLAIKGKSG